MGAGSAPGPGPVGHPHGLHRDRDRVRHGIDGPRRKDRERGRAAPVVEVHAHVVGGYRGPLQAGRRAAPRRDGIGRPRGHTRGGAGFPLEGRGGARRVHAVGSLHVRDRPRPSGGARFPLRPRRSSLRIPRDGSSRGARAIPPGCALGLRVDPADGPGWLECVLDSGVCRAQHERDHGSPRCDLQGCALGDHPLQPRTIPRAGALSGAVTRVLWLLQAGCSSPRRSAAPFHAVSVTASASRSPG